MKCSPFVSVAMAAFLCSVATSEIASQSSRSIELSIWNDADFRRRVAESLLSESDVEPKVTIAERDLMQRVLTSMGAGELDAAIDMLSARRSDGASAVLDFTIATLWFQREEYELAATAFEVAVAKFPKFRRAWRNLGLALVRLDRFTPATKAFTRVLELGGGDAVTFGLLGFCHASTGNHMSAESAYRMATLLDPVTLDWKLGLARSFFEQQRFPEAVALCDRLLVEHPDRADFWMLHANASVGAGRPVRAAESFEVVDRLGQSTPASLQMLGDIYVNEELYDLAVGAYVRALERNPDGGIERPLRAAKLMTSRGALAETQTLVERIEALAGARLDDAAKKDVLKLRARLAVASGAGAEEARVLEEIVRIDPLDGDALILLGQHSGRTGDPEKAIFWFERAASLSAFEADAKVRHAQLLVGLSRYAEALPLLRRAQSLKPRDNIQKYLEQVERIAK